MISRGLRLAYAEICAPQFLHILHRTTFLSSTRVKRNTAFVFFNRHRPENLMQSALAATGTYTNVPGATTPYTNAIRARNDCSVCWRRGNLRASSNEFNSALRLGEHLHDFRRGYTLKMFQVKSINPIDGCLGRAFQQ